MAVGVGVAVGETVTVTDADGEAVVEGEGEGVAVTEGSLDAEAVGSDDGTTVTVGPAVGPPGEFIESVLPIKMPMASTIITRTAMAAAFSNVLWLKRSFANTIPYPMMRIYLITSTIAIYFVHL